MISNQKDNFLYENMRNEIEKSFLVTGENKCSILKEILDKNKEEVYPASYIWHHARNPQLYASLVS